MALKLLGTFVILFAFFAMWASICTREGNIYGKYFEILCDIMGTGAFFSIIAYIWGY